MRNVPALSRSVEFTAVPPRSTPSTSGAVYFLESDVVIAQVVLLLSIKIRCCHKKQQAYHQPLKGELFGVN
jgi:hypothetical protein